MTWDAARSTNGHQKRGYRMIPKLKPPLGWSEEELHCVAAIARYHRGACPRIGDSHFVGLSAKRRSELLPIMGILRLANAFDFNHDRSIARITVGRENGTLILSAQGLQEISPSAERIARARYLLETTYQIPIVIRSLPAKAAAPSRAATRRPLRAGVS